VAWVQRGLNARRSSPLPQSSPPSRSVPLPSIDHGDAKDPLLASSCGAISIQIPALGDVLVGCWRWIVAW
jgi:hypothetical protein